MKKILPDITKIMLVALVLVCSAFSQADRRELSIEKGSELEIVNKFGRVSISSDPAAEKVIILGVNSTSSLIAAEYKGSRLFINVAEGESKSRTDLEILVPARIKLKIETSDGEVRVSGNFEKIDIKTSTGTIATDIPLDDLQYNLVWTSSRPRFLSDIELEEVREKAAGKFVVKGKIFEGKSIIKRKKGKKTSEETSEEDDSPQNDPARVEDVAKKIPTNVKIDLSTSRGIILLNVNPGSVPADLGEKPLTNAAKAIIRSGDIILMEAIRRASPKFFGDYARTLPPFRSAPVLDENKADGNVISSKVKKVLVQVTDINNRSIPRLTKEDFILTERGSEREILSVEPETSSFNLVLLVDVSGSVNNYVDFIRKAARNFVNTVNPNDKVAIVIFNQDVEVLSNFTTDKVKLSESLDSFDAGGGTAYYDAIAYTLAETLRPLKGDRTGIVVLTDGEDTRSFLPFDAILGAIQESGALIYPLYVPNGLIAAARNQDPNDTIDPLRNRYFGLTSRAESQGEELAKVSGGVYYPIRQLDELQKAYDDIVLQLRTAYSITYRSDLAIQSKGTSPFLKVRVKRENSFVKLGSVVELSTAEPATPAKDSFSNDLPEIVSLLRPIWLR